MRALLAGLGALGAVAGLSYLARKSSSDESDSLGEAMSKGVNRSIDPAIRMTMREISALPFVNRTVFSCAGTGPSAEGTPHDPDDASAYFIVCYDRTHPKISDVFTFHQDLALSSASHGPMWSYIQVPAEMIAEELGEDLETTREMLEADKRAYLERLPKPTSMSRPLLPEDARHCHVYHSEFGAEKIDEFWKKVRQIVRARSKGAKPPPLVNEWTSGDPCPGSTYGLRALDIARRYNPMTGERYPVDPDTGLEWGWEEKEYVKWAEQAAQEEQLARLEAMRAYEDQLAESGRERVKMDAERAFREGRVVRRSRP